MAGHMNWAKEKKRIKFKDQILEIRKNEDYDVNQVNDLEEGFLYYKYNLDVYNLSENVSLEEQVKLSKLIYNSFKGNNIELVEIVAEFEHLL